MPSLKLAKLPDRTPIKLIIFVSPELNHALGEYAKAYERAYGRSESAAELVPAMLETFLGSDREFVRTQKSSRQPAD